MKRGVVVVLIGAVAGAIAHFLHLPGWAAILVGFVAFFAAKSVGVVPRA